MKKGLIISIIIITIIIIISGGLLVFRSQPAVKQTAETPVATEEPLEAEQSGVEVSLTAKTNAAVLKITQIPTEVTTIEYELSYLTGKGLPRGVLGKAEIKGSTSISREILLGTCSRNTCVYDQGVKKINLTLKFNRVSGKSTSFSKGYEL